MKYVSVPESWGLYEVPDETFQLLSSGAMTTPPSVVLEVMVMNGAAKKVGSIGTMTITEVEAQEPDDTIPEDGSPFDEDET